MQKLAVPFRAHVSASGRLPVGDQTWQVHCTAEGKCGTTESVSYAFAH